MTKSTDACRARLDVTARSGEQATVPVTLPGLPQIPLYAFARPAGRAVYITVDDGWTPSARVLAIMRRTDLPVTAFLIAQAAQRDLPYWWAFVHDGGTIGDHSVSHPNLTKLTLGQATIQWGQARRDLGRWLGRTPDMGLLLPYGAFNPHRGGGGLPGRAAGPGGGGVPARPTAASRPGTASRWSRARSCCCTGYPALGEQLTKLLAVIHARHLHPVPLTPSSFAGTAPQQHSLGGD